MRINLLSNRAKAEPKSASVESPVWYVVINGQQSGPYTKAQLGEYLSSSAIDHQSFVWKEGMASWESLSAVSELQSLFQQSTPAPVTSAQVTHTRVLKLSKRQ